MSLHNLLEKTELRINGIKLKNANLNDIAKAVADSLGLISTDVLVTDYQHNVLTVDLLQKNIDAHRIVGKKEPLLKNISFIKGVQLMPEASVESNGMLGWIALEEKEARAALLRSEKIAWEIQQKISKRAIIFSTGLEIAGGQVEDTNTPMISARLEKEGYKVTCGPTLRDDAVFIAARLYQAAESEGYGLIITTGGVGAEGKDHTVEAVIRLDPDAATPYICKFEKGTGRHVKDGVKIAVGWVAGARIVSLP
ncbi:MAG: molybdopterin-binding protein, partial [Desulfobacterales bacterium]